MNRAWPLAATVAWLAASVGAAALATGGPMLRPGVDASPMMLTLGMSAALAIGWPLLTSSALVVTLVAGQGVILLSIVALAAELPAGPLVASLTSWAAIASLFYGVRRLAARRQWGEGTSWAALLAAAAVVAVVVLG